MPPRTIAIGDVHGCAVALRSLLGVVQPQADDTIVMLGDCVDRGPDSRGVIEELLMLRERCRLVPILGNHEEMMLNYLDNRAQPDNWLLVGGQATMDSYLDAEGRPSVPQEHIDYIRTWGDYWETDKHFFVHGGYHPEQPLSGQRWNVWRWHSLRDAIPEPHASGKTAIVGHTSQKSGEIFRVGHLICIDTFCYGGGWLTALEPATGQVWQVDRRGAVRQTDA
ncbi:MAG: metallophosphoesterase family protein [Pirellulales bacterium]